MLRRPSIRASVTTLAAAGILVGGANLASYAATGHPLILGHANSAVGTTALKNVGRGPALSLNSAKSSPPLVVNSSKLVKHLNAAKVGGLTAAQLNPGLTTYKFGSAGGTFTAAQHLVKVRAPKGLYRITMSGIWTSDVSTDTITCVVVDQNALTPPGDISKIYALETESLDTGDNPSIIDQTGYATFHAGQRLILGCVTTGDTGNLQIAQPLQFNFEKVTQHVKHGTPTTISKHAGAQHLLAR